jgi:hypothetical protein
MNVGYKKKMWMIVYLSHIKKNMNIGYKEKYKV